jgi:hypothetical protein
MFDSSMLVFILAPLLFALLGVGAPAWVVVWELLKGRTIPPIRVERAKHPLWYWSCVVTHAVILAFMVLVCGALLLLGILAEVKISGD